MNNGNTTRIRNGENLSLTARVRTDNNCRYAKIYDKQQVWELLSPEIMTTTQIAGTLGCHVTTAWKLLRELLAEGRITQTRAGGIWIWRKVGTQ